MLCLQVFIDTRRKLLRFKNLQVVKQGVTIATLGSDHTPAPKGSKNVILLNIPDVEFYIAFIEGDIKEAQVNQEERNTNDRTRENDKLFFLQKISELIFLFHRNIFKARFNWFHLTLIHFLPTIVKRVNSYKERISLSCIFSKENHGNGLEKDKGIQEEVPFVDVREVQLNHLVKIVD